MVWPSRDHQPRFYLVELLVCQVVLYRLPAIVIEGFAVFRTVWRCLYRSQLITVVWKYCLHQINAIIEFILLNWKYFLCVFIYDREESRSQISPNYLIDIFQRNLLNLELLITNRINLIIFHNKNPIHILIHRSNT